ncbi:MAG: HD domain-containing protein [Desulfobacterales bacterium]|nr:HD domain-containing protein [Desulfobacterales bacterium]
MNPEDFKQWIKWFKAYVSGYLTENPDDNHAIRLKEEHTYRVCGNITLLSKKLDLSPGDILLAKTMALFHDLGRFKQYRRYRTFDDRVSQNHAALGVAEIALHNVLSACREPEKGLITSAISHHNAAALPESQDERTLFFMRLLRDADKLDIWRVFCDYYRQRRQRQGEAPNQTIELGLPDLPTCSRAVVAALQAGRYARIEDLRTLNDFKLLQISWVYDLNFQPSFKTLQQRGYIDQIAAEVPQTNEIGNIVKKSLAYMHNFV